MNDDLKDLKDEEQNGGSGKNPNVIMAVVLIVVGIGLVISNLTGFSFNNWWALFLFIPAGGMLVNVWQDYQANGRLTGRSTGPLIAGLAMLLMIAIFLLNLSWSALWPVAFIFGGIALLLSGRS